MRLWFLILVVVSAAYADNYDSEEIELEDVDPDEYPHEYPPEYPPPLMERAAAAISSTDYHKEKEVIKEQMKIKKPKRPKYPPPPPPPYAFEDFDISNIPPLPPKYMKKMEKEDDMLDDLGYDAAAPPMPPKYPPYPPFPYPKPPRRCPNMCDLDLYKKCTCVAPAMYTKDGRGNCNVGASKLDLRVWCYVDDSNGNPEKICPDALPSKSQPGYWWSRIACITG